jgi:ubiquinone/menaquinone biosynthesis C-methylase UbiE
VHHNEAVKLFENGIDKTLSNQTWIDLGAGSGTFTVALADLLGPHSMVYAVDKDSHALRQIQRSKNAARIEIVVGDFVNDNLKINAVDGIIISNVLHFVRAQNDLLQKIKSWLVPDGRLIVLEYDTSIPAPWIPFPLSYARLGELAELSGWYLSKLDEHPSRYNRSNIYAALLKSL